MLIGIQVERLISVLTLFSFITVISFILLCVIIKTVEVDEEVSWLEIGSTPAPTLPELKNWVIEGTKKLTIDDETSFCSSEVLKQVLQCKVTQ